METTINALYDVKLEKECIDYVANVADELDSIAAEIMFKCPKCKKVFSLEDVDCSDSTVDRKITCPGCKRKSALKDIEQYEMWDYFEDCYDIEYHITGNNEYRSVCVTIAYGGPNVYVDTKSGDVELYWAGIQARHGLSKNARNAIDDYFEDTYDDM